MRIFLLCALLVLTHAACEKTIREADRRENASDAPPPRQANVARVWTIHRGPLK